VRRLSDEHGVAISDESQKRRYYAAASNYNMMELFETFRFWNFI
jgi:hypothetical protein